MLVEKYDTVVSRVKIYQNLFVTFLNANRLMSSTLGNLFLLRTILRTLYTLLYWNINIMRNQSDGSVFRRKLPSQSTIRNWAEMPYFGAIAAVAILKNLPSWEHKTWRGTDFCPIWPSIMASTGHPSEIQSAVALVKTLTNAQLKDVLKTERLPVSGVKVTLQIRIIERSSCPFWFFYFCCRLRAVNAKDKDAFECWRLTVTWNMQILNHSFIVET